MASRTGTGVDALVPPIRGVHKILGPHLGVNHGERQRGRGTLAKIEPGPQKEAP